MLSRVGAPLPKQIHSAAGAPASPFVNDVPEYVEEELAHVRDRIACLEGTVQSLEAVVTKLEQEGPLAASFGEGWKLADAKTRASLVASGNPRDAATGRLCARSSRLLRTACLGKSMEKVLDVGFLPLSLGGVVVGGFLGPAVGPTLILACPLVCVATALLSLYSASRAAEALETCGADLERVLNEERQLQDSLATVKDAQETYRNAGTIETDEESVKIGPVTVPRQPKTGAAEAGGPGSLSIRSPYALLAAPAVAVSDDLPRPPAVVTTGGAEAENRPLSALSVLGTIGQAAALLAAPVVSALLLTGCGKTEAQPYQPSTSVSTTATTEPASTPPGREVLEPQPVDAAARSVLNQRVWGTRFSDAQGEKQDEIWIRRAQSEIYDRYWIDSGTGVRVHGRMDVVSQDGNRVTFQADQPLRVKGQPYAFVEASLSQQGDALQDGSISGSGVSFVGERVDPALLPGNRNLTFLEFNPVQGSEVPGNLRVVNRGADDGGAFRPTGQNYVWLARVDPSKPYTHWNWEMHSINLQGGRYYEVSLGADGLVGYEVTDTRLTSGIPSDAAVIRFRNDSTDGAVYATVAPKFDVPTASRRRPPVHVEEEKPPVEQGEEEDPQPPPQPTTPSSSDENCRPPFGEGCKVVNPPMVRSTPEIRNDPLPVDDTVRILQDAHRN